MKDSTFDNPQTRKYFISDIVSPVFKTTSIEVTRGKQNVLWDMVITDGPYKGLTVEVKTRAERYDDFAVEITQYGKGGKKFNPHVHKDESGEYKKLLFSFKEGRITKEEVLERVSKYTAWAWRSRAKSILYINPQQVCLINKKKLIDYVVENFFKLEDKFSDLTSGSYNKIVKKSSFKAYKDYSDIVSIDRYIKSWTK